MHRPGFCLPPSSSATPKQCKGLWLFCKEQCFLTSSICCKCALNRIEMDFTAYLLSNNLVTCANLQGVSSSHGCTAPGKREAKIEINCARNEGLNSLVESRPIWNFCQPCNLCCFNDIFHSCFFKTETASGRSLYLLHELLQEGIWWFAVAPKGS